MIKNVLGLLVAVLISTGALAQSSTNTVRGTGQSVSEENITATIERIDRLIDALYEKDKIAPLSEKDALRLDRLQEARMLAELRLQHGDSNNKSRMEELLEQAAEESPAQPQKEAAPVKKDEADELDSEKILEGLGKESAPARSADVLGDALGKDSYDVENLLKEEPLKEKTTLSSKTKWDALEQKLNLSAGALLQYRQVMEASAQRTAQMDQRIAREREKMSAFIDDDFPDYSDLYECCRNIMDIGYEKAIEQVELRRDLRSVLSEEQFKTWLDFSRKEQPTQAVSSTAVVEKTLPLSGEDEDIVYVPMRLVRSKDSQGKTVYQARPLETKDPLLK